MKNLEAIAVIEISEGSYNKYEIIKNKKTGKQNLFFDRFVPFKYPTNYGFIPETLCGDGEELDILLISKYPITPNCLINFKTIGILKMIDNDQEDHKIIAVNETDDEFGKIEEINDDILIEKRNEIFFFFANYKKKSIKIIGFFDSKEAIEVLKKSKYFYNKFKEKIFEGTSKNILADLVKKNK